MGEVISERIVLARRPQGAPQQADFRLERVALPAIREGEILLETRYLSLDPYMRGRMDDRKSYSPPTPVGVMEGEIIARAVQSRNPGFQVGENVAGRLGWLTHTISDGSRPEGNWCWHSQAARQG